jgi:hypothetical protein
MRKCQNIIAMANTFCFLNIHCIFSTKERAPMLNPELRDRLWPFLGPRHFVPGYYQPVPPGQSHSPIEAPHHYLSAYGALPKASGFATPGLSSVNGRHFMRDS